MTDKPAGTLETTQRGFVTELQITNPARRNAMTYQMWSDLGTTLESLASNPDCRALVLCGAGDKAFCAGNDISEFEYWRTDPDRARQYAQTAHAATDALGNFPKPVIGAIQGFCIGGGFELALLCDLRVCAEDASFAVTPARLGLGYDLNDTQLLVDRIGASAAREMLFTASRYDANEALRLGIVQRVFAADKFSDGVTELTDTIGRNAPLTVQASKAIVGEALKPRAEQNRELCAEWVDRCQASEDFAEGRAAFAEKRAPEFKGQ